MPEWLWTLATESIFDKSSKRSREQGKKLHSRGVGLFDPETHQEYCKRPATKRQKEAASVAIRDFWAGLSKEEKTARATKASLEAAKKTRKKVLLTYPDGSTKIFDNANEARVEANVATATFVKMRKLRVKSRGGFLAEDLNE